MPSPEGPVNTPTPAEEDVSSSVKCSDCLCKGQHRQENKKISKVKKLCEFFENIIERSKAGNNWDKNLLNGRASCPARIEKAASLGNLKFKSSVSRFEQLSRENHSSHLKGSRSISRGTLPKRAKSLESGISIIKEPILEEEDEVEMIGNYVEEIIEEVTKVVKRESMDRADDYCGVVGNQEFYKDIVTAKKEDHRTD